MENLLAGWLVVLFYGVLTLFGSFNAELSHFDKFQTIWFCISIVFFVYTQSNVKTVLFQTIQFSLSTQFSSIWPIDRTLSGTTAPIQSGPGSDSNEGVLHIPKALPSDCLVSYLGHLLGESYPFAEMQSVYSAAAADWTKKLAEITLNAKGTVLKKISVSCIVHFFLG